MNLEDLFEAQLAGEQPEVPEALGEDLKHALAAHEALQFALGETILLPASDADDRTPPSLPVDYEIVRELGRGGMGVVYLARQKSLDRLVAVKVLRPGELAFGPMVRRFLDEAKHLARLRHPNLVSVHEVGEAGGEPYFSMDYIEGESLADLLRRERLSPSRALAILKQAAEGVAHAHQTGIIHRDLKPANILIDAAGRAYVTDFGLARNLSDESDRTHSGTVMGTPQYMAPEQARGETRLVGEATDVHALGAILYEMLTGRPPYGSDNPMQILVRLVHEEPTPPRRIDPRIARDLETICLKALAKQPTARYATVRAMLEDIHRYETGQPLMARRPGIGHHAKRLARRYGKLVAAAVLAAAVAAAAVWAIVPKPVDQSLEELIGWGESEHGGGRHAEAVKIYRRALLKAAPAQRPELLDRTVRCVREIDDPRQAVDAAVEVLDDVPDASFGKYDLLIAHALRTRLRDRYPSLVGTDQSEEGGQRPTPPKQARPLMQMLEKRLLIALGGPLGTADERRECVELLDVLGQQLARRAEPVVSATPNPMEMLRNAQNVAKGVVWNPDIVSTQLLALADDEALPAPVRMVAAFKAGEKLEESGDKQAASDAYRKTYSLRSKFPFYAITGVSKKWGLEDPPLLSGLRTSEVCAALRDAYAAWRRLDAEGDPSAPDDLRGGLRVRFEVPELPRQIITSVGLRFVAVGEPANAPATFFEPSIRLLVQTAPIQVGVADGRYRLTCGSKGGAFPRNLEGLYDALVVDTSALPAEVEVRGETIDLPPIRLRVLDEIKALSPADGESVDLTKAVFRWAPLTGAVTYRVDFQLSVIGEGITTLNGLGAVCGTSTNLCLGTLPPKELLNYCWPPLPQQLVRGRTGVWTVSAYDANNVQIGKTYGRGARFLVSRGLAEGGD